MNWEVVPLIQIRVIRVLSFCEKPEPRIYADERGLLVYHFDRISEPLRRISYSPQQRVRLAGYR